MKKKLNGLPLLKNVLLVLKTGSKMNKSSSTKYLVLSTITPHSMMTTTTDTIRTMVQDTDTTIIITDITIKTTMHG